MATGQGAPGNPTRTRRRILWLAAGAVLMSTLILILGPQSAADPSEDPRASSFLSTHQGARGLYLAMETLDHPVERSRELWTADDPTGTLVLLRPTQAPDSLAVEALGEWVRSGGTLLLVPRPDSTALSRGLGVRLDTRSLDDPATARPTDPDAPHSWLQSVDSVGDVRRVLVLDEDAGSDDASEATPSPQVLLATDAGDPVLVRIPLGEGGIVAWSDVGLLTNESLRENHRPAVPIVRAAASGARPDAPIRFDEFHHGFRGDGAPIVALGRFLTTTGWGRWTLQAGLAALLLLILGGHRFGTPRSLPRTRGRSPLEHAEALAAVYNKAGANRTVLNLLAAGFRRRLGVRSPDTDALGIPPSLQGHPAAQRLAREWARGDDADLEALSRAMDQLILEARG